MSNLKEVNNDILKEKYYRNGFCDGSQLVMNVLDSIL